MILTRNATIFAAINSITSLIFFITLNHLVTTGQFGYIAPWAIAYGLTWAITGALLGGTDKARNHRGNIEFQFAGILYVIAFLSIWGPKLFLPAIMPYGYGVLLLATVVLVVVATLHYNHVKNNPKGINKKEAFK